MTPASYASAMAALTSSGVEATVPSSRRTSWSDPAWPPKRRRVAFFLFLSMFVRASCAHRRDCRALAAVQTPADSCFLALAASVALAAHVFPTRVAYGRIGESGCRFSLYAVLDGSVRALWARVVRSLAALRALVIVARSWAESHASSPGGFGLASYLGKKVALFWALTRASESSLAVSSIPCAPSGPKASWPSRTALVRP